MGIVILSCYLLNSDFITFNYLRILLLTCIDDKLLLDYPCGSMYKEFNMTSPCFYVFIVTLIIKCIKLEFDYIRMVVATDLG